MYLKTPRASKRRPACFYFGDQLTYLLEAVFLSVTVKPRPFWLRTNGGRTGWAPMSSVERSATLCCCNVKLAGSRWISAKDPPKGSRLAFLVAASVKIFAHRRGSAAQNYAWNGFGGTGVEMQRRTSSPQQEPCPAYTASECLTSCSIRYDSDRSEIRSDSDEEWKKTRSAYELKDAVLSLPLQTLL